MPFDRSQQYERQRQQSWPVSKTVGLVIFLSLLHLSGPACATQTHSAPFPAPVLRKAPEVGALPAGGPIRLDRPARPGSPVALQTGTSSNGPGMLGLALDKNCRTTRRIAEMERAHLLFLPPFLPDLNANLIAQAKGETWCADNDDNISIGHAEQPAQVNIRGP